MLPEPDLCRHISHDFFHSGLLTMILKYLQVVLSVQIEGVYFEFLMVKRFTAVFHYLIPILWQLLIRILIFLRHLLNLCHKTSTQLLIICADSCFFVPLIFDEFYFWYEFVENFTIFKHEILCLRKCLLKLTLFHPRRQQRLNHCICIDFVIIYKLFLVTHF